MVTIFQFKELLGLYNDLLIGQDYIGQFDVELRG